MSGESSAGTASTRAQRLGLVAGYAAPPGLGRPASEPERHLEMDHPGQLVQVDCFCVGRLSGISGTVWQYTAIDVASAYVWAELHVTRATPRRASRPRWHDASPRTPRIAAGDSSG